MLPMMREGDLKTWFLRYVFMSSEGTILIKCKEFLDLKVIRLTEINRL